MMDKEETRLMANILSTELTRASIAARLGKSFGGDRDIYTALGYIKTPQFQDYMARYKRQDIAKAIINKPVAQSWMLPPEVVESKADDTEFERSWKELVKKRKLFHYMSRVDRLAGIGDYAVLVLGTDDGESFEQPLKSAKELLYVTPASQINATISTYENDSKSPRFALPVLYQVQFSQPGQSSMTRQVHYTRIIHIAEDKLEDDISGTPRLEAVLNRLQDLELIVGGSAEMFWRGGFPGYGFKVDDNAQMGDQDLENLQAEIEDYMHGLKRYLRLRGITVEGLTQQLADPTGNVGTEIDLIACATGIPKRILMGSERGELASSMDEKSWLATIDARRKQHCEPTILRPIIDRLIDVGILPTPKDGYTIEWPDMMSISDKEIAEIGQVRATAIKNYLDSGADAIMPPESFFKIVLGMTDDDINSINDMLKNMNVVITS